MTNCTKKTITSIELSFDVRQKKRTLNSDSKQCTEIDTQQRQGPDAEKREEREKEKGLGSMIEKITENSLREL